MLRQETYRKGSVTSTLLQLMAQGLAFVFNMVMAACFGAILATDVFNYCFTTFTMVAGFMLALDTAVLIPEAMRRRYQESEESSMQFLNFFLILFLTITAGISLMAMWKPIGFLTAISQFDVAALEANRDIILWVIPVFALQLLAQYTNSILVSYKFFSLPAMWGVFFRILNIIYVLCFYRLLGVVALAQSLILGLLLQVAVAFWLMRRHLGWKFHFRWPRIQMSVWRNIGYTEMGMLVMTLAVFSPVLMASAAPEGFVTAMNYALKMAQVPESLMSTQIALIVGIKLNELASKGDGEEFGRFYQRMAGFMFWCCTPLAFFLYAAAPDILRILLLRGAYTEEALHITVVLFQGLIVAFPAIIYNALLLQVLAAQQNVLRRNVMDIVMCTAIFISLWVLVPHVGLLRFPWIRAACLYGVHFVWMLATRRRTPNVRLECVYGSMWLNVAINAGIFLICMAAIPLAQDWPAWLRVFALAALYAALWGGLQVMWKWDRPAWGYAQTLLNSGFQHVLARSRRNPPIGKGDD